MKTHINADLHCHSTVSDGTLDPDVLAQRAFLQGVTLWSLTDHDELSGQTQAQTAAQALGMDYCCGVEISVTWAGKTIHIVGLHFDPNTPVLVEGLASVRAGRVERAHKIAAELTKIGITDTYQGALQYAANPSLISRTHFARHLVSSGVCRDINDVFSRYLTPGYPGYIPHTWASLSQAVSWIRAAHGTAIIAHPGRYQLNEIEKHLLYEEFKALGGTGIEVITGSHRVDQYHEYTQVALRYGFLASRGADFHGPKESHVDLGCLPFLSEKLTPVWHAWA